MLSTGISKVMYPKIRVNTNILRIQNLLSNNTQHYTNNDNLMLQRKVIANKKPKQPFNLVQHQISKFKQQNLHNNGMSIQLQHPFQNEQQNIEIHQLKQQNEALEKEKQQLQSQLSQQINEKQQFEELVQELKKKQTNQDYQNELLQQQNVKLKRKLEDIIQQLEEEQNQKYVLQNQCKELDELAASLARQIEFNKYQQPNQQNQKTNHSINNETNMTDDISFILNDKSEILGNSVKHLSMQSNILQLQIKNDQNTEKKTINELIQLLNQYQLQEIKQEQFIQKLIKILCPPLPIALVLGKPGVGKTRLLEQLFNLSNIKEFVPILHADLDCYFVDTMGFDFKSNIDKREHQILLFKKLFKQYPNKVANIFIVVNFERTDMMKNKIMEVNRYFKKFQDKISFIITNFDLSENVEEDKQHLQEKLSFYKNQVLIFTGKASTQQQIIESLKPVLVKQNENQVYPFDLKDTMFEEEDENETNEMLNRLNEQFRH